MFTSKLQTKLPKFHRPVKLACSSRPPRTHHHLALAPRKTVLAAGARGKSRLAANPKPRPHQPCRYAFKKKSKPVFVDKLFKESTSNATVNVCELVDYKESGVRFLKKSSGVVGTASWMESEDDAASGPEGAGTSRGVDDGCGRGEDHDRMWESAGLASPLMQNIDERAEAFISKFRAEMERQEAVARRQTW